MKSHKILICGTALIIMHYVDFMLFDKGFPAALLVTAAAGAFCGGVCGERKFTSTAVNTVLTLVLYAVLIFLTGRLILITNKTVDKKSSHNPYTQDYARFFVQFLIGS